jgi:hypothetical protein
VDQRHKWQRIADWASKDSAAASTTGPAPRGGGVHGSSVSPDPHAAQQAEELRARLAAAEAAAAQRVAVAEAGARAREDATRRLLEAAKQVRLGCQLADSPYWTGAQSTGCILRPRTAAPWRWPSF